jgi:hypothetical protein
LFPVTGFLPSHAVGIISLVVLAAALFALYAQRLAGKWRWIYVTTAVAALYFNVFVLVAQAFQKLGFLHALAPTGSEPPFAVAQAIVLLVFIFLGYRATKHFQPVL